MVMLRTGWHGLQGDAVNAFSFTSCLTAPIACPLQALTCLWPYHWKQLFGRGLFIGRGIFWSASGGLAVSVLDLPCPAMPCHAMPGSVVWWSDWDLDGIWPG